MFRSNLVRLNFREKSEMLFRTIVIAAACVVPVCASNSVLAATHTYAPFTRVVANVADPLEDLNPTLVALTGAPAGLYNGYSVSVDWGSSVNDAWSTEAVFGLSDTNPLTPSSVLYAAPTSASNSQANASARTLNWSGYLNFDYDAADPLHLAMAQSFDGSTATWGNVTVTLMQNAPKYVSNFSGSTGTTQRYNRTNLIGSGLSAIGTSVPYRAVPFFVDLATTYDLDINYNGFDGMTFLYAGGFNPLSPVNDFVVGANGFTPDGFTVPVDGDSFTSLSLLPNVQYFLVVAGFGNSDLGTFDGTFASSTPFAAGTATIGVIPEPALLGVVAGFGLVALRRRSRLA